MPYLDDVTPDLFTTSRSRLTLARIELWMLYPDDAERRSKAYEAAATESLRLSIDETVKMIGADAPLPDFTIGELQRVVGQAVSAPRISDMQQSAMGPFLQGMAAGLIVFEVIAHSKIKPVMSGITRAKRRAIEILKGHQAATISMKTIDNDVWPRYRPVAHLWGAYVAQCIRGDDIFPCRLARAEEFLAEAELMAEEGIKLRPPQSPGKLLRDAELRRIRPDVALPSISVTWVDTKSSPAEEKRF